MTEEMKNETMPTTMSVWNAMRKPPERALKTIKGGRLQGMTDINPQWRYEAMTEQFGICGIGWKYEIVRVWNEPIQDGQIMAFAEVKVYVSHEDCGQKRWSDPIPGIGGSMLVAQEKGGLRASDEAYKMAITDALSVALKVLGVAADIYAGLWDGSKYLDELPPKPKKGTDPHPPTPPPTTVAPLNKAQAKELFKIGENLPDPFSQGEVSQIIDWYCNENGRTYESGQEMIANFTDIALLFMKWHRDQQSFEGSIPEVPVGEDIPV